MAKRVCLSLRNPLKEIPRPHNFDIYGYTLSTLLIGPAVYLFLNFKRFWLIHGNLNYDWSAEKKRESIGHQGFPWFVVAVKWLHVFCKSIKITPRNACWNWKQSTTVPGGNETNQGFANQSRIMCRSQSEQVTGAKRDLIYNCMTYTYAYVLLS